MIFSRGLQAIDSHTAGEPTRIITGGITNVPGDTMPEKKAYLEEHMDHIRTAVMLEPRGHNDMFVLSWLHRPIKKLISVSSSWTEADTLTCADMVL